MNAAELKERASKIQWFHPMDLGSGVYTRPGLPGRDFLGRFQAAGVDFAGKDVLDIGAWDGKYSFEAKQAGARSVLATDCCAWDGFGWGSQAGFNLAREVLCPEVTDKQIDVYDMTPETVGTFDIVMFFGVLYHLKHPLLALERLQEITRECLLIETHVGAKHAKRPMAEVYPRNELSNDGSNWFGFNQQAIEQLLTAHGFRKVECLGTDTATRLFFCAWK